MLDTTALGRFSHTLFTADNKKNTALPLKDHPHIPLIIDTLSRKSTHHLLIFNAASEKMQLALLDSVAHHLSAAHTPKTLRKCEFIYFDTTRFLLNNLQPEPITADLRALLESLHSTNNRIIIALTSEDGNLPTFFSPLLAEEQCCFIVFTAQKNPPRLAPPKKFFTFLPWAQPTNAQLLGLLKTYRAPLENFHQVIIAEDTFASAYTLAKHYLSGDSAFDNALELLDNAAARASMLERGKQTSHKAIVSSNLLLQVISQWTQIPLANLQSNKFQANKLIETLRTQIFGQDAAINLLANHLQNACIKLYEKNGPLASFLFVGPDHVGKATLAAATAEYLFGHKQALLRLNLQKIIYPDLTALEVTTQTGEPRPLSLLTAIAQTPYAVILLENIECMLPETLHLLQPIFTERYIFDAAGNKYDFGHAIFILTTQVAAPHLQHSASAQHTAENTQNIDLMQLVFSDPATTQANAESTQLSSQEIYDELLPKLTEHFPTSLLQELHVIPFVALDYPAFEKIIRIKAKALVRRLDIHFGIELTFAPEAIKFLAHEAFWRKPHARSLDKLLEQHLYACIAHELLQQAEDKNRSKRLSIQLNDMGQVLRCELITANETHLYSL